MSVATTKLSETYCDTLRLASHQRISTRHGPHRHLGTNPQAITTVAVMTHKSDQDTGGTCHARPLDSPGCPALRNARLPPLTSQPSDFLFADFPHRFFVFLDALNEQRKRSGYKNFAFSSLKSTLRIKAPLAYQILTTPRYSPPRLRTKTTVQIATEHLPGRATVGQ